MPPLFSEAEPLLHFGFGFGGADANASASPHWLCRSRAEERRKVESEENVLRTSLIDEVKEHAAKEHARNEEKRNL
jgi:hypothetical protein